MDVSKVGLVSLLCHGMLTGIFSGAMGQWIEISPAIAQTQGENADRLLQQGKDLIAAGQPQQAQSILEQALRLFQQANNRRGEGSALKELGVAAHAQGQEELAIRSAEQALAIARLISDRDLEWRCLNNLGLAFEAMGHGDRALGYFQEALEVGRASQNLWAQTQVASNLAGFHYKAKAYDSAIAMALQGLETAQDLKNPQLEYQLQALLAQSYEGLGEAHSAITHYGAAITLTHQLQQPAWEANLRFAQALLHEQQGQYAKAIDQYQPALAIAQTLGLTDIMPAILGGLGQSYQALENYPLAAQFLEQQLAILRQQGNPQIEQTTLSLLGNVYRQLGQLKQAFDAHQMSLNLAIQLQKPESIVKAQHNLANDYADLGNYAKAIALYQEAIAQSLAQQDEFNARNGMLNLGQLYDLVLGDPLLALTWYNKAIELKVNPSQTSPTEEAKITIALYLRLAIVLQRLGKTTDAITTYEQGLALARTLKERGSQVDFLSGLGSLYQQSGNYQKAIASYQESLALAKQLQYSRQAGVILGNLALLHAAQGDYNQAIALEQQRLDIARASQDPLGESVGLNNLGAIYLDAKRPGEAQQVLQEALNLLETSRQGLKDLDRVAILETQGRTYRLLQQAYLAQQKPEDALVAAEQGRGQAIAALMNATSGSPAGSVPGLTIHDIRRIASEQQATLVQYSILYETLEGEGQATQPRLSKLLIWVISPDGEINFKQVPLAADSLSLDNLVADSRVAIGLRSRAFAAPSHPDSLSFSQNLKQLYGLLIAPIESWLPSDPQQSVIVIPQGVLNLVPYAALQDSQGQYLIDRHAIGSSASIQLLDLTQALRRNRGVETLKGNAWVQPQTSLIVGNPTMPSIPNRSATGNETLPPLDGAEKEAQAIAALFKTRALIGNTATEEAIRQQLPHAKLVHLATHGLLDYGNRRESLILDIPGAIALAPSARADGLLTAAELAAMKLQANLVVLSACDTGQGRVTGDGVIGLGRSLMGAGVPSVLVSLWSVPDAPTAELMTSFYGHLQSSGNLVQALRQAMIDTKANHPDPVDWAAFTLMGHP